MGIFKIRASPYVLAIANCYHPDSRRLSEHAHDSSAGFEGFKYTRDVGPTHPEPKHRV